MSEHPERDLRNEDELETLVGEAMATADHGPFYDRMRDYYIREGLRFTEILFGLGLEIVRRSEKERDT